MLRGKSGLLLFITACLLSQGCVPGSISYLRVDAPGAVHLKSLCGGTVGAPEILYYPFESIFISVDPQPILLGLHVPAGVVAQMDGDMVRITGTTSDGPVSKEVRLQLAPQNMIGTNVPAEFRKLPDAFTSDLTTLSPLTGASSGGYLRWYLFISRDDVRPGHFVGPPPGLLEGTIELPPITIDGHRYPAQVLRINRASYATVIPVNC
jgi:hypothetical protein